MIPLGVASVWLSAALDRRPVDWVEFSKVDLEEELADGNTVLVFFSADWDLTSVLAEKKTFGALKVRRLIRSRGVIAMRADCTNGSPKIAAALKSIDRFSTPTIAIYDSDSPKKPIVLDNLVTEPDLLAALKKTTRRW